MDSSIQYRTTLQLIDREIVAFNRLELERDDHGTINNFLAAQPQAELLSLHEEDGDVVLPVEGLVTEDGTHLWPASSLREEDGQLSPIGHFALELTPLEYSLGEHSLHTHLFDRGMEDIRVSRGTVLYGNQEAVVAVEEMVRERHYMWRFNQQQRSYWDGLWLQFEATEHPQDVGKIYVARIALFIMQNETPGLLPVVFSAEGSMVGYLPEDIKIHEPWLYARLDDNPPED